MYPPLTVTDEEGAHACHAFPAFDEAGFTIAADAGLWGGGARTLMWLA